MKKLFYSFTLLFILFQLGGCQKKTEPVSVSGFYFDTFIVTTIYSPCEESVQEGLLSLCEKYEDMLSAEKEGSDIWRINHSNGNPVEVSPETIYLLERGLYYSALTNGTFDITIRPVSSLWDFHSDAPALPDDTKLADAMQHVHYDAVLLQNNMVTLTDPDASIELGALAKGYIAEKIKEYLLFQNVDAALINLGGNLCAFGTKQDGSRYTLGIEKPFSSEIACTLKTTDTNLVTSGIYERCFTVNGILYHHLLDGNTGFPVNNNLYSVSIMGPDGTECDLLSTVCFLLGEEEGTSLLESMDGYEGYFIKSDYSISMTSGFGK